MTKPRILLVEDDEFIGTLVRSVLNAAGYEVEVVETLPEVRALPVWNYAAVLTDFQLPGGDGADVIAFAREKIPGLPALILSGYGAWPLESCVQRGLEGVQHLGKPFRSDQLLHAVEALVPAGTCRDDA